MDSSADGEELLAALAKLSADPALCTRMGDNGRSYAAKAFDIEAIADKFTAILQDLKP